jgi:hypothetical protein
MVALGGLSFVYAGRAYSCSAVETTWEAERQ